VPGSETLREIEDVRETLKNDPFQDGYVDFLPTPSYRKALDMINHPHPHKSMLRDLVYYYQHHSYLMDKDDWKQPRHSSVFLRKIVAAYYLQLVDYIKVMLPSLELKLTTAWVEEQEQWKSLQTISRRCGNYRDDLEDTILSLGYPVTGIFDHQTSPAKTDWKNCEKDFQYAYFRLKILKERVDNLTTSIIGLASIAGNRQSLEEAKRVKRLNLLALLFIPLAYTSSLFSMQDEYAPNQRRFWVYWVSAFGVVLFTAVITFILDSALDESANWTWKPVKWLRFWELDSFRKDKNIKRRPTGLFDLMKR